MQHRPLRKLGSTLLRILSNVPPSITLVNNGSIVMTRNSKVPSNRSLKLTLGDTELLGEKMALARLLDYYRLTEFRAAGFSVQLYAGASLEAGNVYAREESITGSSLLTAWSLFVGANTPMGPVFLGYGRTEDRDRFYLSIGDRF